MRGLTFLSKPRRGARKTVDDADDFDIVMESTLRRTSSAMDIKMLDPSKTFTAGSSNDSDTSSPSLSALVPAREMIPETVDISVLESVDSDGDLSLSSLGSSTRGAMVLENGDEYEGALKDGVMHGLGVLTHVDGRVYKGDFVNGRKYGTGISVFANGDKHVGGYVNDYMCGRGTFLFSDGHKYCGQMEMDKFHGVGTVTYADGIVFHGTFFTGTKTSGSYIFPSGEVRHYEKKRSTPSRSRAKAATATGK